MFRPARRMVRRILFGPADFRQQRVLGLTDPQQEVQVWLHGFGDPLDVTDRHVIASAQPLTIGIPLHDRWHDSVWIRHRPVLKFRERGGAGRLLGEIGLRPVASGQLSLFEVCRSTNYCASKLQLWRRRLAAQYERLKTGVQLSSLEGRCLSTFYICPRPVALVSVMDGDHGNIFPMDLIGPVGARKFSLALHKSRQGVALMEHSRRVAVSSVPVDQTSVAYGLGKNHRQARIDWTELPFDTAPSPAFRLPVPRFALRVRELEIISVQSVGDYKHFLADTVEDQSWADGLQLHFVHGFYDAWRSSGTFSVTHRKLPATIL